MVIYERLSHLQTLNQDQPRSNITNESGLNAKGVKSRQSVHMLVFNQSINSR